MTIQLAQANDGNAASSVLFLVVLGVVFYVIAVRPNRRRMRAAQSVQAALAPGREVMTASGLYGTVVDVADDMVQLEVAPGVVTRHARAAVVRLVDEQTEPAPAEPGGAPGS